MRRMIAILMAMLMVLSLVACGAQEEVAPEITEEVTEVSPMTPTVLFLLSTLPVTSPTATTL